MLIKIEELIALAEQYQLPYLIDIKECPLIEAQSKILPYAYVKQKGIIPIEELADEIKVAFAHPYALELNLELEQLLKKKVKEVLVPKEKIDQAIDFCYRQNQNIGGFQVKGSYKELKEELDYDLSDHESQSEVVNFLNMILVQALRQKASDIHFEPHEQGLFIRYRIDGVMQSKEQLPKEFSKQVTTRIKVLSKLDIAEQRLPQDGRIKLRFAAREIDFRVSTIPAIHGERVVLRILDKGQVTLGLDQSGMENERLGSFRSLSRQSQGVILVTGPTGSGKTSTLYSAIAELDGSQINIMTIEDPVEYKLKGLAQISVNHKIDLTFSKGLRHILRQDPDVIMIGEIRDKETAEIAIQAALTGHLVFSTLHTNDAASALTRLVDMGIEPYLLTSSVLAVLAQRLVRRICPHCKKERGATPQECSDLRLSPHAKVFEGAGCEHCFGLGYRGREGIFELMVMSQEIKKQLLISPDSNKLQEIALKEGMKTMRDQGIEKVLQGITTCHEVQRVTKNLET